jgi:hypothetical protein
MVDPQVGPVVLATVLVADLAAARGAYEHYLSYRRVDEGTVGADLAASWGAPGVSANPYAVLAPESGEPGWLRLVEGEVPDDHRPLASTGWAAIEILIRDPDEVAARLEDSPFDIIGPPAPLRSFPQIKSTQAIGPAGEVLYLTNASAGSGTHDLPTIKSAVDRFFIAVLAVPGFDSALADFENRFALPAQSAHERGIYFIGPGYGLAITDPLRMTTIQLAGQSLIQVDEYPVDTPPRARVEGGLPAGFAMTSFVVPSLEPYLDAALSPPVRPSGPPYDDRAAITLSGPGGALIELIEAG